MRTTVSLGETLYIVSDKLEEIVDPLDGFTSPMLGNFQELIYETEVDEKELIPLPGFSNLELMSIGDIGLVGAMVELEQFKPLSVFDEVHTGRPNSGKTRNLCKSFNDESGDKVFISCEESLERITEIGKLTTEDNIYCPESTIELLNAIMSNKDKIIYMDSPETMSRILPLSAFISKHSIKARITCNHTI